MIVKNVNNILSKLRNDHYLLAIVSISSIFFILFSLYSILAFNLVEMSAWDMGVYMQALASGTSGHLFYSALIPGSYLAEHFSPVLFILVIPYYLFPSAYTLIILQSLAIAFSTLVLYLLSRRILDNVHTWPNNKLINPSTISLVISIAYIMSPLTESPIFFDFHLMVFLPLFFFLALYSFITKRYILNIIFLGLIVSLHSAFISIAFTTIILEIFLNRTLHLSSRNSVVKDAAYVILSFFILGSYFLLAGILKADIAGISLVAIPKIHVSGSVGPISIFVDLFKTPLVVLNLLTANYMLKLTLLFFAFGGFAFLFIRYPITILTFVPYLLYAMFSGYGSYYSIGYQYPMMFIPMVAFSSIMGIYVLAGKQKRIKCGKAQLYAALAIIIAVAIVGFSIATPIVSGYSFNNSLSDSISQHNNTQYMEKVQFEHKIARSIDKNASVVTENNLFPLFGNYPNATAFPYTSDVVINGYYYQFLVDDQKSIWSSEVVNFQNTNMSLNMLEHQYIQSGKYGIYAQGYGIIVLEKGYTGSPKFT